MIDSMHADGEERVCGQFADVLSGHTSTLLEQRIRTKKIFKWREFVVDSTVHRLRMWRQPQQECREPLHASLSSGWCHIDKMPTKQKPVTPEVPLKGLEVDKPEIFSRCGMPR